MLLQAVSVASVPSVLVSVAVCLAYVISQGVKSLWQRLVVSRLSLTLLPFIASSLIRPLSCLLCLSIVRVLLEAVLGSSLERIAAIGWIALSTVGDRLRWLFVEVLVFFVVKLTLIVFSPCLRL